MGRVFNRLAVSGLLALGLVSGVALSAQAATYWISPYLTGNKYDYTISDCVMFSQGWGSAAISAYEHAGDRSGDIGVRVVDSSGTSSIIDWDPKVATAYADYALVAKYKLYHY